MSILLLCAPSRPCCSPMHLHWPQTVSSLSSSIFHQTRSSLVRRDAISSRLSEQSFRKPAEAPSRLWLLFQLITIARLNSAGGCCCDNGPLKVKYDHISGKDCVLLVNVTGEGCCQCRGGHILYISRYRLNYTKSLGRIFAFYRTLRGFDRKSGR